MRDNATWWISASWYEDGVSVNLNVAGPYWSREEVIRKVKEWNACPQRVHEELFGTKKMPEALYFRVAGSCVAILTTKAKLVVPRKGHIEPDTAA